MKTRVLKAFYAFLGAFFLLPSAALLIKSLIYNGGPSLLEYWELFTVDHAYFGYFWNSVFYSAAITAVSIAISLPLGFSFAKIRFKGSKALFYAYLLAALLPFQATLLPNYICLKSLNMLNTPLALTLPMMFSPLAAFLTRQFALSVPDELIDSARLETSSALKILRHAVWPHIKPGAAALAALIFCESWNTVEQALIFAMDNPGIYPLSVRLSDLPENVSGAGGATYMFPIFALFLILRKPLESSESGGVWETK